jgi:serine protease Do
VLTAAGQLLGINTNRLGEGFYLAIPADEALRGRADALARGESAQAPRLGVAIAPNHVAKRLRRAVGLPETDGLLIRGVEDDSPAARAGLAQGDLIVAAAGRPIRTPDDLFEALQAAAPGGGIELNLIRGTGELTVQVSFAEHD